MRIQWAAAILGVVALAALTLSQLPTQSSRGSAPTAIARADAPDASSAPFSCPADAKPANLDFTMNDASGRSVTLSDFRGKVLVLDFWATWCGPCKVEIPHFIEMQRAYGEAGLQIVGISIDDTPDKLQPYMADMKMNYPVLQGLVHDDVQDAFGPIVGIPLSVIVSRDGRICAKHEGLTAPEVFEREIKALL